MGSKGLRTLVVSGMLIMLSTATAVGATYALWSDTVSVKNHLKAGSLNATLKRSSFTKTILNENGELVTVTGGAADFSGENAENVFGIAENELVVPGCSYEAALVLSISDSIPFTYTVSIQTDSESGEALADYMVVSTKVGEDGTYSEPKALSEFTEGNAIVSSGEESVSKGQSVVFYVKIEFLSSDAAQNAAQGQELWFDLVVEAVQVRNS